ncbi:archaellum operon transcriptional activator EarA family protein [Thermococcus litoralis]|uniref:archaellum operon transcriptional activator EarA family protein n=1 Tax=Thermococcus litoralis TaxID=2265 RepID=UPI000B34F46A|nr:archaellum operon transcriptional activator EarA family protein [Thermococcus litoralis]
MNTNFLNTLRYIGKNKLRLLRYLARIYPSPAYLSEIAKATNLSIQEVKDMLLGTASIHQDDKSLVDLGLVDIVEGEGFKYYRLSEEGKNFLDFLESQNVKEKLLFQKNGVKGLVRVLDTTLSFAVNLALLNLLKLGLEYGVFHAINEKKHYADALVDIPVRNKVLLKTMLETYTTLGFAETAFNRIWGRSINYKLELNIGSISYLTLDVIPIFDRMLEFVEVSLNSKSPISFMDFDKNAEFWDMRLNSQLTKIYRTIIKEIGGITRGKRVLDLGCGSVSPEEIGKIVGYEGVYTGVDFSHNLLNIAKRRVKRNGLDWVTLKEIDVQKVKPKGEYDVVIVSFLLEYIPNVQHVINSAVNALGEGGKLIIVEPFRENYPGIEAWEFFEKLTKEFIKFPSKNEIIYSLESTGRTFRVEEFGKSVLAIEVL